MGLNLVMMATGEFALPSLQALVGSAHRFRALITQPDRLNPRGVAHPHPLKEFAIAHQIPVLQPESINTSEAVDQLRALQPDAVIVAAYGQILKAEVIGVPPLGMYNLHASLLPRHRGAAPVQYAIWKGDRRTGVTIFRIEPKLDAGPMIIQQATDIFPEETAGQLHDRLAVIGAQAVLDAVQGLEQQSLTPQLQDASLVTLAPKIRKEQGEIHWSQSAAEIDCHLRAMQPWPNPFTFLHRPDKPPERLLILAAQPLPQAPRRSPGQIEELADNSLSVACGSGILNIQTIQKAGKKPMHIGDFLRGNPLSLSSFFGPETPLNNPEISVQNLPVDC